MVHHSVITKAPWDAPVATPTATIMFMVKLVFSLGAGKQNDAFGTLAGEKIENTLWRQPIQA